MKDNLKLLVYTMLVFFFFVAKLTGIESITYVLGIVSILCIFLSLIGADRLIKLVSSFLLLMSLFIIITFDVRISELPNYATSTVFLIAIIYQIPFLYCFFKVSHFDHGIQRIMESNLKNMGQLYNRSVMTSYILTLFLFISSFTITYESLKKHINQSTYSFGNKLVSQSMLRGYAFVSLWSPIEIMVALPLFMTGIDYLFILPYLLMLSVLLLIVNYVSSIPYKKYNLQQKVKHNDTKRKSFGVFIEIFIFLVGFFILSIIVHMILGISFYESLALIIIPYSIICVLIKGRMDVYKRYVYLTLRRKTLTLHNFMALFLSVGFMNVLVNEVDVFQNSEVFTFVHENNVIWLFVFIQITTLLVSFIGVHPLIPVGLFGSLVQPVLHVASPESLVSS